MKKILISILFCAFSCTSYAQYLYRGGVVAQGMLMNEVTVRSGFDVYLGGGSNVVINNDRQTVQFTSLNLDFNAGYNVSPYLFFGGGIDVSVGGTAVPSLYVNACPFFSKNLSTLFLDFRIGKILGQAICHKNDSEEFGIIEGNMFGFSLGYLFDKVSIELGANFAGGSQFRYEDPWEKELRHYGGNVFDWSFVMFKVAYRLALHK